MAISIIEIPSYTFPKAGSRSSKLSRATFCPLQIEPLFHSAIVVQIYDIKLDFESCSFLEIAWTELFAPEADPAGTAAERNSPDISFKSTF